MNLTIQNYSQASVTTATSGGQFINVTRIMFDVLQNGVKIAHYQKDFMSGRDDTGTITADVNEYMKELRARLQAIQSA